MSTAMASVSRGKFSVRVEGNRLISNGRGPGSKDLIGRYIKQVTPLVQAFNRAPWVSMTILEGIPLSSPEGAKMLSEGVAFCVKNNLRACAIVIQNTEYLALTRDYWQAVHAPFKQLDYRFFTSQAEADSWLTQVLEDS